MGSRRTPAIVSENIIPEINNDNVLFGQWRVYIIENGLKKETEYKYDTVTFRIRYTPN